MRVIAVVVALTACGVFETPVDMSSSDMAKASAEPSNAGERGQRGGVFSPEERRCRFDACGGPMPDRPQHDSEDR